jgi:hypothetical protein
LTIYVALSLHLDGSFHRTLDLVRGFVPRQLGVAVCLWRLGVGEYFGVFVVSGLVPAAPRRRRRKNRAKPAKSRTPTMQAMTMPAMAPPERLLLDAAADGVDVEEARKTVVVGAGLVDVCMLEEEV